METRRYEFERGQAGYPAVLEELEQPPEILYVMGDPEILKTQRMGIIGARRATSFGIAAAQMAGRVCAESGVTVVSGGALGCDSAAARAALDAGGTTIVVVGTGADQVYPSRSRDVYERSLATGGAIVSIRDWGAQPARFAFPQRNLIIAALGEALMVCEAGVHSGTSSTAVAAAKLGRRVYAVPGSIFSKSFAGTNRLIADGATIICDEQDLETSISMDFGLLRMSACSSKQEDGPLLTALLAGPCRPDELTHLLGIDMMELLHELAALEAAGVVSRLYDGRYAPSSSYLTHRNRR
jgi:DNA processing protein